MKIKNIKINNYGNLENKNINLENKINIIYGKNESGKSTLLNYIKNIFYGISKTKNGKEISDFEKYKPWTKEEFSGKLKYELDCGDQFEVYRDFNKRNPRVFNGNLEDISDKFNIDKKDGIQFFYEQTNVNEDMFLSTVVSMQQGVRLSKESQANLIQRVANLADTGDDNISFKRVIDRLNKRQVEEIGTQRTQGKPINVITSKMKDIELVKKDMQTAEIEKQKLENEKKKIESEIEKLELKDNITKRLHKVNIGNLIEIEKIKILEKEKIKNKEKIQELKNKKNILIEDKNETEQKNINDDNYDGDDKIKKYKNKRKIFLIIFFVILIIIILTNIINIKNEMINKYNYILLAIDLIIIIYEIIINNKIKKIKYEKKINKKINREKIANKIDMVNNQINDLEKQIEELIDKQDEQEKEINSAKMSLDIKIDLEIEKIKKENKINIDNILDEIELNNIENKLNDINEELKEKQLLLNKLEIEEKEISIKLEKMLVMQEEYLKLKEELNEIEEKNNYINLAKEYIIKAYEEMK